MNSLDWSGGMDHGSGVLDWTTGVGGAIFLKNSHRDKLIIWHFIESQSRYIG